MSRCFFFLKISQQCSWLPPFACWAFRQSQSGRAGLESGGEEEGEKGEVRASAGGVFGQEEDGGEAWGGGGGGGCGGGGV